MLNNKKSQEQTKMEANQCGYGLAEQSQGAALSGLAGRMDTAVRESIRERIALQLNRAIRESHKAEQLRELSYLLDKNPEVARILDLIEAVNHA